MKTKLQPIVLIFLILAVLISACSPTAQVQPTQTAVQATVTPDPCQAANRPDEVKKLTALMHAFDDTGYVASFTPQAQLSPVILNLQDIRRQVENLPHPVCLMQLHQDAISYMNAVVTSLVSFMAGVDRTQLTSNVSATQKMRQVYEQELANVLGLPYATPTPVPTQAAPANTPAANMPALENTPAPTQGISGELPQVQNASTLAVNIRSAPDMASAQIGVMAPGDGAQLLGRNEAGDWLLIATPNGQGWVFTRLVKVNVVLDTYPVITATPKP